VLLLFIMWEVELVPVYLLVSIWGGSEASVRRDEVLTVHCRRFYLYFGCWSGNGILRRQCDFDLVELGLKDYPLALELLLYAGCWLPLVSS
jgi:NAD(P)H-quinone oxidoreductase subunit 4